MDCTASRSWGLPKDNRIPEVPGAPGNPSVGFVVTSTSDNIHLLITGQVIRLLF